MRDRVFIAYGIGCLTEFPRKPVQLPREKTIRAELQRLRDLSTAHWAYLEISGRRVDDDRIGAALRKAGA